MPNDMEFVFVADDPRESCWADIYVEQPNYKGFIECSRVASADCKLGLCASCCPLTHAPEGGNLARQDGRIEEQAV